MENREPDTIVVPKGEGDVVHVMGETIAYKLVGGDTGDVFALFEVSTPPQTSIQLHTHLHEDETYHVLEGEYEFQCGDGHFRAPAGTLVFLPRDFPHAHRNVSSGVSRMVLISTPSGVESYWKELAAVPADSPPDQQRLVKIAKKHHIELHGAPIWQKKP